MHNDGKSVQRKLPFVEWEKACKKILEYKVMDEKYPELYEQIVDSSEPHNYYYEPYSTKWRPQLSFIPNGFIPYPKLFESAFEHLKKYHFQGILPEIHHTWFSVDNKLFLWDYTSGKENVIEYDDFEHEILSVGIVKVKKRVFKEGIKYALVVATNVEINLIVLKYTEKEVWSLHRVNSKFQVSTDNDCIRSICGMDNGRVFVAGGMGNVLELEYNNDASIWHQYGWKKNCYLKQHTWNLLQSSTPEFISEMVTSVIPGIKSSPIMEMVIDDERKFLFTLNDQSCICIYDLGVDGKEMKFIDSSNVFQEAIKFCSSSNARGGSRPDRRNFNQLPKSAKITAISVVGRNESAFIHLVAMSNTGVRFYFSTFSPSMYSTGRAISNKTRPKYLAIQHIRLCPPVTKRSDMPEQALFEGMQPGFSPDTGVQCIERAYMKNGVCIFINSNPASHGDFIGITQDFIHRTIGAISSTHRKPVLRESVSSENVHGAVYAVQEYINGELKEFESQSLQLDSNNTRSRTTPTKRSHDSMNSATASKNGHGEKPEILGELATQFFKPQRIFLCLTHMGLYVIKKLRPIDYLHQILVDHVRSNEGRQLKQFFAYFGVTEVCCMLFGIACGIQTDESELTSFTTRSVTESASFADSVTKNAALRAALEYGGHASAADNTSTSNGQVVMTDAIYTSGHHDGMVFFVSRILRPIWNRPLAKVDKKLAYSCAYALPTLQSTRETLFQLKQALENTMPYADWIQAPIGEYSDTDLQAMPPTRMNVMTRTLQSNSRSQNADRNRQLEALKTEKRSIRSLYLLVCRSMEAISLLVSTYNCPASFAAKTLQTLTFSELSSTVDGAKAATKVIQAFLEESLKQNGRVDALVNSLRRECSTFFTVGDVWKYQGQQVLVQAKQTLSSRERHAMLKNTLDQFLKASKHWKTADSLGTLESVCREFSQMYFFNGIVDLSLECASNFIELQNRGESTQDNNGARIRCYQNVLNGMSLLLAAPKSQNSVMSNGGDEGQIDGWFDLPQAERDHSFRQMLERALASDDELFHRTLYEWLFGHNYHHILVEIRSAYIESYLESVSDDLLSKYFVLQRRFAEASLVMQAKAQAEFDVLQENPTIHERIEYYSRALTFAESAQSSESTNFLQPGERNERLTEIREKLDVVMLQAETMEKLQELELDASMDPQTDLEVIVVLFMPIQHIFTWFRRY